MGSTVDVEADVLRLLLDRKRGQHHPRHVLRRGIAGARTLHLDGAHRRPDDIGLGLGISRQRQDGRGIAQHAAIVGAVAAARGVFHVFAQSLDGRGEGRVGAVAVTQHGKRRGHLRAGKRRPEIADLCVGQIFEVTHRGPPGPRQNIERVSHILAAACFDVRRVAHHVADIVEGCHQRVFRHVEALFAGPQQEVGDIGREPQARVVAIGRPQAEGARARLAVDEAGHGLLHPVFQFAVDLLLVHAKIAEVEQRQGAAHRLLGAAIGIAVKIAHQACRIELRQRAHRERHRGGAGQHVGHEVLAERQRSTFRGQRHGGPLGHHRVRRPHAQCEVLVEDDVAWAFQRGNHACRAEARRGDRHDDRGAGASRTDGDFLDRRSGLRRHRPVDRDAERVVASRCFGIDDVEAQPRGITHRHEARQRTGHHDGIAHDHVGGRMAHLVLGPGHRHHAHRAVEGRNVEVDRGRAVSRDLHDAGVAAQGLLRRGRGIEGRTAVTAGAQLAALALHAVDQHAVDVAQFGGQALLVEVVVLRRRRIVAREVEDADVHRSHGDEGFLAGAEVAEFHRNGEGLARLHHPGRRQLDVERARRAVDAEPGQSHGARRHALGLHIHRLVEARQHIGAGTPTFAHREGQGQAAFRHVHRLRGQQLLAHDLHRGLAGIARLDLHVHRVAGLRIGLVDGEFQRVGRVGLGAVVIIVARREVGRDRRQALRADLEAVFTP